MLGVEVATFLLETKSNQSSGDKCRGFFISLSLEIGILPVEGLCPQTPASPDASNIRRPW
jgi:hypothetical protein